MITAKKSKIFEEMFNEINIERIFSIDKKFFTDFTESLLNNIRKYKTEDYNKLGGKLRCNLSPFDRQGLYCYLKEVINIPDVYDFLKQLYLSVLDTKNLHVYKYKLKFAEIKNFDEKKLKKNKIII